MILIMAAALSACASTGQKTTAQTGAGGEATTVEKPKKRCRYVRTTGSRVGVQVCTKVAE